MKSTLWDSERMTIHEAIDLTVQSLNAYGPSHEYWSVAFSGGKDSTALITLIVWLIEIWRSSARRMCRQHFPTHAPDHCQYTPSGLSSMGPPGQFAT